MPPIDSRSVFGGEVQYFRLEPRYWAPVLDRLVETGLRTVTSYVPWSAHAVGEPETGHPAGVLDFEGRTDPRLNLHRFLELVEARNLHMNFRAGPFCCNEMVYGGLPPWIVFDPDLSVWDYQNRTTQGYWVGRREGSQPSYLHPRYLEACGHWLDAVAPIIRAHLRGAGGCITMLNLDNEVSYIVQDSFLDSDYNPVNVEPGGFWHQFLAERYGSAGHLPYPRRYAEIEEVPVPRSMPGTLGKDLPWHLDWIRFKTWCMVRYLAALRAMYAARGIEDVTFMTNLNPHRPEGVPTRMPDFERATGGIVGYDFYRGSFMSYSGYQSMARVLKLMRASMQYVWSAEFMAGIWNKELPSRVSDDHMRFMARCALAHGCKALSWFMFHDRDVWGDSPVSSHGHRRPSHPVLTETVALALERIEDWDALEPIDDVAVIYDPLQHQHTALGDPSPCADNALHRGAPSIDGVEAGVASASYEGLFRLVEQTGRQPGAVDVAEDPARLDRFPVALLPGGPILSREGAAAIDHFVRAGGRLIVDGDAWPGRDELGAPLAWLGFEPDAPPPAGDLTPVGQGSLIRLGTWAGHAAPEQEDPGAVQRIETLIAEAAGPPAVRLEHAEPVRYVTWAKGRGRHNVEQPRCLGGAVLHAGGRARILFVMNLHPEAACFRLTFAGKATALVDLETGETTPVEQDQAVVDIDRKAAAVYRVTG